MDTNSFNRNLEPTLQSEPTNTWDHGNSLWFLFSGKRKGSKVNIIKNLLIIILFTIGAILLPMLVIDVYYSLVPAEEFYKIESPVSVVDPKILIKPCRKITMSMYRNSRITTEAVGVKTLIKGTLINQDNNKEVYTEIQDLVLNDTQGFKYIEFYTTLPCDVEPGNYYIEGNVHFTIRGHDKESPWVSEIFPIK